ncbi:hypothetical protein [Limnoglobus roseus]|uniref:Uncharacterized protein n=1 Tax=Limnoglobus roseus TaxID=2598579 RepID=A0A5C1A7F3_9BACT|nr:hypothetical protein [Limnoglobus roseus]QEL13916.1 hypothetical protein PX52LOC_00776 [Limnoglobus roseus]
MKSLLWAGMVILVMAGMMLLLLTDVRRGVGWFDQPIIVDSDKPIQRVVYFECNEDDGRWWLTASRSDQEKGADVREAKRTTDQFIARVKFTTRTPPIGSTTFYQRTHLGLRLEFVDETWATFAITIPPGRGQTAIKIVAR